MIKLTMKHAVLMKILIKSLIKLEIVSLLAASNFVLAAQPGGGIIGGIIVPGSGVSLTAPPPADSSRLSNASVRPTRTSMQGVTEVTLPCFTSMQQVENFVAGGAVNRCDAASPKAVCYVQLTAREGDLSTSNILTCPNGYSSIFSYGSSIVDSSNGSDLTYTPNDTRTMITQAEYIFYTNNQYACYDDRAATSIQYTNHRESPHQAGPTKPSPTYSVGSYAVFNNYYVHVNRVERDDLCKTAGGYSAPDSTCNNGIVVGAYWVSDFTYYGTPQMCVRFAGFYPTPPYDPSNPDLPQASSVYSPTILICGRILTNWKSVGPNGQVAPTTCINP